MPKGAIPFQKPARPLYLSAEANSFQEAADAGIAAGRIYQPPEGQNTDDEQIRVAFDGDALL